MSGVVGCVCVCHDRYLQGISPHYTRNCYCKEETPMPEPFDNPQVLLDATNKILEKDKESLIDPEKLKAFERWNGKQTKMQIDHKWMMDNLLVWKDDGPLDLDVTFDNLFYLLEGHAMEVRKETLWWVKENLWDRLEQHLEEDPPGVDMWEVKKIMVEDYDWKEKV